jgi:hypothetical protein
MRALSGALKRWAGASKKVPHFYCCAHRTHLGVLTETAEGVRWAFGSAFGKFRDLKQAYLPPRTICAR